MRLTVVKAKFLLYNGFVERGGFILTAHRWRHLPLLHRICVAQTVKLLCKSVCMPKACSKRQIVLLFAMSKSLKGYKIL